MRALKIRPLATVALVASLLLVPISSADARTTDGPTYREGTLATAVSNFFASPAALPGVNDWSCTPSAEHPDPVILVHATYVNVGSNFAKLAPRLLNQGYCVYAENYGMTPASLGRVGGLGPAADSVSSLSRFVSRVRSSTGASKVDLVGHSQGGMIAFAYIKLAGGADKVGQFVAWGGTQNGTTLDGLVTLASALNALGFTQDVGNALQLSGMTDQTVGSRFQRTLWADPTVPSGPEYTTIASRYDAVSTSYANQALDGANNVVLQERCPADRVGHIGMFLDGPTLALTQNALDGGPDDFRPSCQQFGPAL